MLVLNYWEIFDVIYILVFLFLIYHYKNYIWRNFVKILNGIVCSSWYRLLIKPIALGLPSVILACYKIDKVKDNISPKIINFFDENILFIVFSLFIVPAITGFEDIVKSKSSEYSEDLSTEVLFLLLTALESPVNQKMDRFLNELNSGLEKKPGEIFKRITDPDKQLAEITRSIHVFFESWSKINTEKKTDFTTVIFKMKNNVTVDAWSYFPQYKKPEPNLMSDENSLVSYSVKNKKMVIVSDIEREKNKKKRKRISDYCLSEKGSAICYPISTGHTKGDIPLVIRVTANQNFFDEDSKELYKKILEKFKKRILIEYALGELKLQTIS